MNKKGHAKADKTYGINLRLTFVLSTFKVVIQLYTNYQLELRNTKLGEVLGFEPKLITKSKYVSKLPNITNSICVINVHCDAITDLLVDGVSSNKITAILTDNLSRSFLCLYELRFLSCSPVSSSTISQIGFISQIRLVLTALTGMLTSF